MEDSPSGLWRTLGKRVGVTASRVRISYPPPSGFWLLSKPFCYPHPHAYTQRSKYVHNRAHSLFLQWRGMAHIPRRPNSHNFRATTAHKNTKMRLRGTSECHMSAKQPILRSCVQLRAPEYFLAHPSICVIRDCVYCCASRSTALSRAHIIAPIAQW